MFVLVVNYLDPEVGDILPLGLPLRSKERVSALKEASIVYPEVAKPSTYRHTWNVRWQS